jgi:hypothetical protein
MHVTQYACVGERYIFGSRNMTDAEIRDRAGATGMPIRVERYDRCPECEEWTARGGKLIRDSKCPAVQEAIKAGEE